MEPTRLIDGDGDGFEVRLLGAARRDRPPKGAVMRAIGAVALSAGAASAATSAAAASLQASTGALGVSIIAKWVGIGAAVGLVATSGLRLAVDPVLRSQIFGQRSSVAAPVRTAPALPAATFEPAHEAPPVVTLETAPPATVKAPPKAAPSARAALRPRPEPPEPMPPPAAAPPPSIAAEIQLVERARQAILRHAPSEAQRALDEYSAAPRTGVLAAEAEVLRVEALLQFGQKDRALALAAAALLRAPNGPHAARMREIVALDK